MGDGGVEQDLQGVLLRERSLVLMWHGGRKHYQTLFWTYVCKGWHNISCAMAALV